MGSHRKFAALIAAGALTVGMLTSCSGPGADGGQMSVADIRGAVQADLQSFTKQHDDKPLQVTGYYVTSLGDQIILSPTPDQKTYPTGDFIVKCSAPVNAAKDVVPGTEMTVKGVLASTLPDNAWLTSCQVVSVSQSAPSASPTPTPTPENGIPKNVSNTKLASATAFSNGYAWVGIDDAKLATGTANGKANTRITMLIDTTGNVVYSSTAPLYFTSPVMDGMAFVVTQTTKFGDAPGYEYAIINTSGKTLYTNKGLNTASEATYVLGSLKGGKFLVIKSVSNFDEASLSIACIDSSGAITANNPYLKLDKSYGLNLQNVLSGSYNINSRFYTGGLGDDLVQIPSTTTLSGESLLFDPRTNIVARWEVSQWTTALLGANSGSIYFEHGDVWVIKRDALGKPIDYKDFKNAKPLLPEADRGRGWRLEPEGYLTNGRTYYGLDGKKLFSDESGKEYEYGQMNGGLAKLTLTGADRKHYVTIVDTTGKQLFTPTMLDDADDVSEGFIVGVLNKDIVLMDKAGVVTPLTLPTRTSGWSAGYVKDGLILVTSGTGTNAVVGYLRANGKPGIGKLS